MTTVYTESVFGGASAPAPVAYYERVTPAEGATVVMGASGSAVGAADADGMLVIAPAGPLNNLTILWPADSATRVMQMRNIAFEQPVANVTINQVGGGLSVPNWPGSFQRNDTVPLQKFGPNDIRVVFKD